MLDFSDHMRTSILMLTSDPCALQIQALEKVSNHLQYNT